MKKQKFINYILIFVMLFTYISPLFEIFDIKAEEQNIIEEVSKQKYTLSGIEDADNRLINLAPNQTTNIVLETEENYHMWCSSNNYDLINTYSPDSKTCQITTNNYGKGYVTLEIANSDNSSIIREYVYIDSQLDEYMNLIMNKIPDKVGTDYWKYIEGSNINTYTENCEDRNNESTCDMVFSYYYNVVENETNHVSPYIKKKKVTIERDALKPYISIYNPYFDKDETKMLFIGNYEGQYEDLIWVSENNSVATVDQNGAVTSVGAGKTNIKLYNKNTFEFSSQEIYVIEPMFKDAKAFKESLDNKTIIIDVNHENGIYYDYYQDNEKYENFLRSYIYKNFKDNVTSKLTFNQVDNIQCTNNVCSATLLYTEDSKQQKIDITNMTLELAGIYLYDQYATKGYTFNINYKSFLPEESEITILYDEEYIEAQEDGSYKAIKEGITEIQAISNGYTDKQIVKISYTYEATEEHNNYLNSLKNIELPYSSSDFGTIDNLKYLEKILEEKVIYEYPNTGIRNMLTADVNCINSNICNISIYDKYNANLIGYSYSKKLANISYTNTDTETIKELKRINNVLKDSYVINLDDVIKIENNCNGSSDCVYNALINYTELNSIKNSSNLKVDYEILNTFEFKGNVNGGVNYLVKVSNDNHNLYTKNITINSNHIVTMSAKLDKEERSAYLKNYVDGVLESDTTNTLLYENVYEVTNGQNKFNLILDQKDQVEITSIEIVNKQFEIKTGETKKIKYKSYPENATIGDIKYKVKDEKIAKVSENGEVTGLSKGFTYVECTVGYSTSKIIVAVDMTIKDVLDSYLYMIDNHVIVTYDNLQNTSNNLKNAISNAITNNFYKYTNDWLPLSVEVKIENGKTYAAIKYNSYIYNQNDILSDYKEITYELKGIRLDKYRYELNSGQQVDTKLFFSEGDNNNLYISYSENGIVELNKNGILKALKPGVVSIYLQDKYNKYWNYATVEVDFDKYLDNAEKELKEKPLEVNAIKFNNNYGDFSNIAYNEVWQRIPLHSRSYNLNCNEENLMCSLQIYKHPVDGWYTNELYREMSFPIQKAGIFLDDYETDVELNGTRDINYELLNDTSAVRVKSLTPDICRVENNKIVGSEIGFCTLKYQSNKYINYQHIIVGKQNMIEGYKNLVNSLEDSIEIPFLDFDINNTNVSEDFLVGAKFEIEYGAISNKIKSILGYGDKYRVGVGIDYDQQDYSNVKISLIPTYTFQDSKNYYYYGFELYNVGIEKYISIVPTKIDEDALSLGLKIKNQTKDKYELNLLQYLKFRLSGKSNGLFEYSGFYEMLQKECPDCTYDSFSGGRGGGPDGVVAEGAVYVIFNEDNPIAYLDLSFEANINVLQDKEILSEEEYINFLKEIIKDAYLKAKKEVTPVAKYSLISYKANQLSDDIYVDVQKEFDPNEKKMLYNITVEDITFKTAINNEMVGDLNYTYSVTSITPDKNEIILDKGTNAIIGYSIKPDNATNKEVTFKSSDESIVTVDSKGNVSAIKVGEAYITITSKDGYASTEVKVKVNEKDVANIEVKLGDINCDGKINMTDIIRLRKYFAGKETINNQGLKNADINKDGKVNMTDIIKLRKYLAGKEKI